MEESKSNRNYLVALVVIFQAFGVFFSLPAVAQLNSTPQTIRNEDFTKPLFFDVLGGPDMPSPLFSYSMDRSGAQLNLGPVTLDEKTFSIGLRRLNEIDSNWRVPAQSYFYIKLPPFLFTEVIIELFDRSGQLVWKREIKEEDLNRWKEKIQKNLRTKKSLIRQMTWAEEINEIKLPLENLSDGFRFCISPIQENERARLCSQNYVIRKVGNQSLLGRLKDRVTPRILLNGQVSDRQKEVPVALGQSVRFFAELSTGETFEFTSQPPKIPWSDFVQFERKDIYSVTGFGSPPAGNYKILNPDRYDRWVQLIGFEPTIYDSRKFWNVQVPATQAWLYFQGETGGLFKYPLPTDKVPSLRIRPYLARGLPKGTYRDGVKIKGRKLATTQVSSKEYKVKTDQNQEDFTWSFKASKNAQINRSYLSVQDGEETYQAYHELYKAYANELSGRLSMILASSGLIFMGETAYNTWFEDVLGWDEYYFSKQRWGFSAKYFQSISKYKVVGYGDAALKVVNADLKYRLTPGLWTRDESQGLMLSYQTFDADLEVVKFKVPMLGVGWFWARSMPKVFDDLLSYIPFMNYPKWVDAEFNYYPANLDPDQKLKFNFNLSFHGQILWKDNYFGEAGFGIKRYDFVDVKNVFQENIGYQINTLYGTLGVGLKF